MANLNRRASRRGSARLSRTLEQNRPGGDRRKHRMANSGTTLDDYDPEQFDEDANGQICISIGEGLSVKRGQGIGVEVGDGIQMDTNGSVEIAKRRFIRGVDSTASTIELGDKINEMLQVFRGFIIEEGR